MTQNSTSFWDWFKPNKPRVNTELVPVSGPGAWLVPVSDSGTEIVSVAPPSGNLPALAPGPQPPAVSVATRPKPAKAIPVESREGPLSLRDPWWEYYGGAGLLEWEKNAGRGYAEGYLNNCQEAERSGN